MVRCCKCCCIDNKINNIANNIISQAIGNIAVGPQGQTGADGITPTIAIGDNGNWIINGVDTGVSAIAQAQVAVFGMQSQNNQALELSDGIVPFDTTITDTTSGIITYVDGLFNLNATGLYEISWQVTFDSLLSTSIDDIIKFGIVIDGVVYDAICTQKPASSGKGEISGSAVINVTTIPLAFSLSNLTITPDTYPTPLSLINADVQANIAISKIS